MAQSIRAYEGDKDTNDGDTISYTLEGGYQVLPACGRASANMQDVTGDNNDLTKEVTNYGLSAIVFPMSGHMLRLSYQTGDSAHDYLLRLGWPKCRRQKA